MTQQFKYPTTRFKNLILFFIASCSILSSGFVLSSVKNWNALSLLIASCCTGVYLIYRLNDCIDQSADLKLNIKHFFSYPFHKLITVFLFIVLIPISVFWLNGFTFLILSIASLSGVIYSLSFHSKEKIYRIKNIFFIKNLFIGFAWGALVLIGAGNFTDAYVLNLFWFVTIQVVIGSLIRDVPDQEKDFETGVKSLPVVIGKSATFFAMHGLNLLSFATGYMLSNSIDLIWFFGVIVVWRFLNLIFLSLNPHSIFWGQKFNLMTCVLILFLIVIFKHYEFI